VCVLTVEGHCNQHIMSVCHPGLRHVCFPNPDTRAQRPTRKHTQIWTTSHGSVGDYQRLSLLCICIPCLQTLQVTKPLIISTQLQLTEARRCQRDSARLPTGKAPQWMQNRHHKLQGMISLRVYRPGSLHAADTRGERRCQWLRQRAGMIISRHYSIGTFVDTGGLP